jgi:hypothetical protein
LACGVLTSFNFIQGGHLAVNGSNHRRRITLKRVSIAAILTTLLYISPINKATAQIAANAVPTNLPGVTTSILPPQGFDALHASDEELATYGFPPRPDADAQPKANAAWQKAMSSSRHRLTPQLELTNIFHGPAKGANVKKAGVNSTAVSNTGVSNTNTTSNNWSGSVSLTGATSYNKYSSAYYVVAEYVVPVARQAYGACTGSWDYSSSWIGIDGWYSGDVLQAGTESDALCWVFGNSTYYSAWYEWYPNGSVRINNLTISPGDDIFVEVWNTSSTQGYVYMVNYTTDQTVSLGFNAPQGTQLVGDSAEWIVERPSVNNSLATLTNYISDYFSESYAYTWGGTLHYPGESAALQVWMLDNNGNSISYPYTMGPYGIWFQDEGSAR